jgi:hypothetical protein
VLDEVLGLVVLGVDELVALEVVEGDAEVDDVAEVDVALDVN